VPLLTDIVRLSRHRSLLGQLQGEARSKIEPDGLSCEVFIPLSVMHERPVAVVAGPTS